MTTKKKRTLRDLIRDRPDVIEMVRTFEAICEEGHPDASVALLAAALLDHGLTDALTAKLPNVGTDEQRHGLFEAEGAPLSSFAAKIRMANAMGVLPDPLVEDFQTVRKVRNAFAHAPKPITFDTPEIVSVVEGMTVWALAEEYLAGDGAALNLSRKQRYGALVFLLQFALLVNQFDWKAIHENFEAFLGWFKESANSFATQMKPLGGEET